MAMMGFIMNRNNRVWATAALIACLVGDPWGGILFASQEASSSSEQQADARDVAIAAVDRPAWARDLFSVPAAAPELSPFTLSDERFTTEARLGAARGNESSSFAQRGGYGGRGGRGRRDGALAAIVLGAAATIAGSAILVYANRPECSTSQMASGCGYGTKVVGGAVLTGGIVGLVVGALIWR
jgi:hypothetical protein